VSWHIGNLEQLDTDGYYFRIGRQSRATLPQLDAATGNFVEAEFDSAPYTHALIDVRIELLAIAPKFTLAASTDGIARRLTEVLNSSQAGRDAGARFSIGALSNPEAFIDQLRSALAIRRFTFTFQRRNPFDADELFVKPFEKLVEQTDASLGKATVTGRDLDAEPLEQITRSAAATGDDASARMVINAESQPVTRRLRGSNVGVSAESLDNHDDRAVTLNQARAAYRRIRGDEHDG
jgi:hypothetical protein